MRKILFCGLLLLTACRENNKEISDPISYNPESNGSVSLPGEVFSSMRVIPLQGPGEILPDAQSNLICDGDKFYIVDVAKQRRIDIFDLNGQYLSSVASRGRSGNEYIGINSVQVVDGLVAIYSYHNKAVFYYDPDGTFVKKELLEDNPFSLLKANNGYGGFSGYSGLMPERVVKMDLQGNIIEKYLPVEKPIIPLNEIAPVLMAYDKGILVRESLRNEIVYIDENGVAKVFVKFDFGKYNVPETYFNNSDPYAASMKLLESDYALINYYLTNDSHSVLSVDFQRENRDESMISSVGVETGGVWRWLNAEKEGPMSLFFMSVRHLTPDSDLVLLAEKEQVTRFAEKYPELIGEFESTTENPYIILCRLK